MKEDKIRVGITQGDTNGIGLEVILKTFEEEDILELCTPVIYGNPRLASYHRKCCRLNTNFCCIQDGSEAQPDRVNFVVCDDAEILVTMGKESQDAGRQALLSLERAIADYKAGKVDVLVTAPINKHSIQSEEFHFPGHTEYIQDVAGEGAKSLMILLTQRIRVALVTNHIPVSKITQGITQEKILEKLTIFNRSLVRDFGIRAPRIAVLGLNPHAGDNGLLGTEEQEVIAPAVERANSELGIKAFGPYAADGFFGRATYEHFDGVLAMYHDQGLAPFKTLAMDDGVNFTAGLPIVRTSPDHGTAYDIAGKGIAEENSFRQALYTAIDIFRNRHLYDEITSNPLEHLYTARREDERRPFNRAHERVSAAEGNQSLPSESQEQPKPGEGSDEA